MSESRYELEPIVTKSYKGIKDADWLIKHFLRGEWLERLNQEITLADRLFNLVVRKLAWYSW